MLTARRLAVAGVLLSAAAAGAQQPAANKANWTLSNMFSDTATLRRVSYTTTLVPNWINSGDSLWYNWRDRNACSFYVAYPRTRAKTAMFDHRALPRSSRRSTRSRSIQPACPSARSSSRKMRSRSTSASMDNGMSGRSRRRS